MSTVPGQQDASATQAPQQQREWLSLKSKFPQVPVSWGPGLLTKNTQLRLYTSECDVHWADVVTPADMSMNLSMQAFDVPFNHWNESERAGALLQRREAAQRLAAGRDRSESQNPQRKEPGPNHGSQHGALMGTEQRCAKQQ